MFGAGVCCVDGVGGISEVMFLLASMYLHLSSFLVRCFGIGAACTLE